MLYLQYSFQRTRPQPEPDAKQAMVIISKKMLNIKLYTMKKYLIIFSVIILVTATWIRCTDFPVDEDGLLITDRAQCYVSSFELLGVDDPIVREHQRQLANVLF